MQKRTTLEITAEERLALIKACEIIKLMDKITDDMETEIPDDIVALLEDIDDALTSLV